jgi:2-methylisocitrate lyase-like PEP mutase family enzyme
MTDTLLPQRPAAPGATLEALIRAPEILVTPGVYDGFSARLVEQLGFKTASISGAGTSESRLGWADRGLMGLEENLANARRIADCTGLLLQADADTGYGNALNVYFVVRAFESAGMAAIMIEDQVWPKRCGHMAGKSVIPAAEMVDKIKAACDARRDERFVIKARTDAAGPLGLDEAIERLQRYAEAGADCLFADALTSRDDIARVACSCPKPLSVNMGLGIRERRTTPLIAPRELQALGVAQVTYPRLLTSAALRGMTRAMEVFMAEVVEGGRVVDRPDLAASFDDINRLMGLEVLDTLERRYAGAAR